MRRIPLIFFIMAPLLANAASFEGTLQALVQGFVGKILPILALGYLGKNIFDHVTNDPNASKGSVRVAVAIVCLMGVNAVWGWLQDKVR